MPVKPSYIGRELTHPRCAERKPALTLRFRVNQIPEAFNLREVKPPTRERATREFSRLGRAALWEARERAEHGRNKRAPGVDVQLEDIFGRERAWTYMAHHRSVADPEEQLEMTRDVPLKNTASPSSSTSPDSGSTTWQRSILHGSGSKRALRLRVLRTVIRRQTSSAAGPETLMTATPPLPGGVDSA